MDRQVTVKQILQWNSLKILHYIVIAYTVFPFSPYSQLMLQF